jgi:integrase
MPRPGGGDVLPAQGVHPRVAMQIMGHSDFGRTMNVYSHVTPDLQRAAVAKMDAILGASS